MWFDSWSDIVRIASVGVIAYSVFVAVLRLFGKRTLSQFNQFDFVITVALGSVLATVILNGDVTLAEGATALLVLVTAQLLVALATSRSRRTRSAVTARPTLLLWDGKIDHRALHSARLSLDELRQAIRSSGAADPALVAAAVLEANGTISMITRDQYGDGSALGSLHRPTE